jgi:hypothetical protein
LGKGSHGRVPDEVGDDDGPAETLGLDPSDALADGVVRGEYFGYFSIAERGCG